MAARHAFVVACIAGALAACDNAPDPGTPESSCSEFLVGGDLTKSDFGAGAAAKAGFAAFAQSGADFAAAAGSLLGDVSGACARIALDLGASADDPSLVGQTTRDRATAWCNLASARVAALFAEGGVLAVAGSLRVEVARPHCAIAVETQVLCQAACGACTAASVAPTCTGGALVVACEGQCDPGGAPAIACQGACAGMCAGECTPGTSGVVDCDGRCEGACAAGGATGGAGIDSLGNCKGTCTGKCALREGAAVTCSGTCDGMCGGACKATAGATSVQCSGACSGTAHPLACEGGVIAGGCPVDASCQADCNATATSRASCAAPHVDITASGAASLASDVRARFDAAVATLETNLPVILLASRERGKALSDLGTTFVGAIGSQAATLSSNAHSATCAKVVKLTTVEAGNDVTSAYGGAILVTQAAKLSTTL